MGNQHPKPAKPLTTCQRSVSKLFKDKEEYQFMQNTCTSEYRLATQRCKFWDQALIDGHPKKANDKFKELHQAFLTEKFEKERAWLSLETEGACIDVMEAWVICQYSPNESLPAATRTFSGLDEKTQQARFDEAGC